jgi:hypothetical protein
MDIEARCVALLKKCRGKPKPRQIGALARELGLLPTVVEDEILALKRQRKLDAARRTTKPGSLARPCGDDCFSRAMMAAIAAGLEHQPPAPTS